MPIRRESGRECLHPDTRFLQGAETRKYSAEVVAMLGLGVSCFPTIGGPQDPERGGMFGVQPITGVAFERGQHICSVYDTREEQCAVAIAFIADGLRKQERCLYVAGSAGDLEKFRGLLQDVGIDAQAAETSGALILMTSDDAHLAGGSFDSERMLRMLNDTVEKALNDGFTGLRTCGDMSWLLCDAPGTQHVVEYEAVLNQFFRNVRALGMCQYDRARLPAHFVDHAGLAAHSTVVMAGEHITNGLFVDNRPR